MHRPVHLHIKMRFFQSQKLDTSHSQVRELTKGNMVTSHLQMDHPHSLCCAHTRTHTRTRAHTQSKVNVSMATHPIEFLGTNVQSYKSTWIYTSTCSLKSFHSHRRHASRRPHETTAEAKGEPSGGHIRSKANIYRDALGMKRWGEKELCNWPLSLSCSPKTSKLQFGSTRTLLMRIQNYYLNKNRHKWPLMFHTSW